MPGEREREDCQSQSTEPHFGLRLLLESLPARATRPLSLSRAGSTNQMDQRATLGAMRPQDLAVCVAGALSSLTSGRAETGGNAGHGRGACSKAHGNPSSSCGCPSVPPVTAELALDRPPRVCSVREMPGQEGQEPERVSTFLLQKC